MSDPWTEGIDCFEDYDEERCVSCIRKNECAFYQPKKGTESDSLKDLPSNYQRWLREQKKGTESE